VRAERSNTSNAGALQWDRSCGSLQLERSSNGHAPVVVGGNLCMTAGPKGYLSEWSFFSERLSSVPYIMHFVFRVRVRVRVRLYFLAFLLSVPR